MSSNEIDSGHGQRAQQRLSEAEKLLAEIPDADPEEIWNLRQTRASLLIHQAKYAEAEPLFDALEAHFIATQNASRLQKVLSLRASNARHQTQWARAERFIRRALAIGQRLFPEHSPQVAAASTQLLTILTESGQLDRAKAMAEKAQAVSLGAYGKQHPSYAITLANIAMLFAQAGPMDKADAYYRHALEGFRNSIGFDNARVAKVRLVYGNFLNRQGEYGKARSLLVDVVETRRRIHGDSHPEVANARVSLGDSLTGLGRFQEAKAQYLTALTVFLAKEHQPGFNTASARNSLALLHYQLGEAQACMDAANAALEDFTRLLPKTHWILDAVASVRARCLILQGHAAQARAELDPIIRRLEGKLSAESAYVIEAKSYRDEAAAHL